MRLADLDAQLVSLDDPGDTHSHYSVVGRIKDANGVMFYCPHCTAAGKHAHYVLCWTPVVPAHHAPGPGRWTLGGTGLADLTLSPSVVVNACGAHFWVRDGAIVDC